MISFNDVFGYYPTPTTQNTKNRINHYPRQGSKQGLLLQRLMLLLLNKMNLSTDPFSKFIHSKSNSYFFLNVVWKYFIFICLPIHTNLSRFSIPSTDIFSQNSGKRLSSKNSNWAISPLPSRFFREKFEQLMVGDHNR